MARKGRHKKGGRVTPKGTRPRGVGPGRHLESVPLPEPEEPELLVDLRELLRSDDRLGLLALASSLLNVADPRNRNPFERGEPDVPSIDLLIDSLVGADMRETSALLCVLAELTPDPSVSATIHAELARRRWSLPDWLQRLGEVEVARAAEMVHVLGDGDNIMLGLRFADGDELTLVGYIDHNAGTVMKDGFAIPDDLRTSESLMRQVGADPDTEWRDVALPDARERITAAIERGAMTYPPYESESWPSIRPLLEWATTTMPTGGAGYERPEWSAADKASLVQRFFASEHGARLDDPDHHDLLDSVLWFGTDYGPGDPLRWSDVAVEILLLDWFPRKIVADADHLAKLPALLRGFIRYCHAERGVRAELTADTLAAVDAYEPEYQSLIRSDRPQGVDAIFAAMGVGVGADAPSDDETFDPSELDELLAQLRQESLDRWSVMLGGADVLERLDAAALPDEPFSWGGIDDDVRDRVAEVLALCDGTCDALLTVEHRTAVRRLLAEIASTSPELFRRRGASNTAAAALCWLVAKQNLSLSQSSGGVTAKALAAHVGVKGSVSQRANTLLAGAGLGPDVFPARFLVGNRRAGIIRTRDRVAPVQLEEDVDDIRW